MHDKQYDTKPKTARRRELLHILAIVTTSSCTFVAGCVLFDGIYNTAKTYAFLIIPSLANTQYLSKLIYYITSTIISLITAIIVAVTLCKYYFPNRIKRDKDYILNLFNFQGENSPMPTRMKLVKSVYGKGKLDKEIYRSLSEQIDKNVLPIHNAINDKLDHARIITINSKWGSGKTTSLLVAINETDNPNYRYIYEAAFKYSGNVNELIKDILKTLNDTMLEAGIETHDYIKGLIQNLDSDFKKIIINHIKNIYNNYEDILSTDLIYKINKSCLETNNDTTIFLIIDDLDRLQGKDIVRILSLLSILRNLVFIKIIIPADREVIDRALTDYKVIDAPRFIEKYLPTSKSIKIDSGYELATKITLDKIINKQKEWDDTLDGAYPALAAIFLGLLSKKAKELTTGFSNYRHTWLTEKYSNNTAGIDFVGEELEQLLRAPSVIYSRTKRFENTYDWDKKYNNIKKFQNIIYAIRKSTSTTGTRIRIKGMFTNQDYIEAVDSWIFDYMETRWDIFGFTIRDILDELKGINYENLPRSSAEQFTKIYNQIFPKEKLNYLAE